MRGNSEGVRDMEKNARPRISPVAEKELTIRRTVDISRFLIRYQGSGHIVPYLKKKPLPLSLKIEKDSTYSVHPPDRPDEYRIMQRLFDV
jgi:hypothetical protein